MIPRRHRRILGLTLLVAGSLLGVRIAPGQPPTRTEAPPTETGWTPDPANAWCETSGTITTAAPASSSPGALPSLPIRRQPTGSLSNVIVYCGAGHGLTADTDDKHAPDGNRGWYTQRPLTHGVIEDFGNIDQLNFLADYCFHAGATVVPFRPLGFQPNEVVLDNVDPHVGFSGPWKTSASTIYHGKPGDVPYLYVLASPTQTATARYVPNLPEAGSYPVYTWVRQGADRTRQLYRIVHRGGIEEVRVDHRRVGRGWVWLGTYYFEAGTTGFVEISNQAAPEDLPSGQTGSPAVVIADAVRFGNGRGDIDRGTGVSGFPREFEAARYWVERMLGQGGDSSVFDQKAFDDQDDNVGTPPRMAALMNRETEGTYWDRIFISFHTNASGQRRGALGLFNREHPTVKQREYATMIHDEVDNDLKALDRGVAFPGTWNDTGGKIYGGINYGEIRNANVNGEMTATILEVAYHDKPEDAELLRNPAFRHYVARATYRGMVRFLNQTTQGRVAAAVIPDPPTRLRAHSAGGGSVALAWDAPVPTEVGGGPAAGYIVSLSMEGHGFGPIQTIQGGDAARATLGGLPVGRVVYLRVSATGVGGESLPSRPVAVRVRAEGPASLLLVDGVGEYDGSLVPTVTVASGLGSTKGDGGTVAILRPRSRNPFEPLLAHANALDGLGIYFDSCDSDAAADGRVSLDSYKTLVWMLGKDVVNDTTLQKQTLLLRAWLDKGGALAATGRAIPWPIVTPQEAGASFTYNLQPGSLGDHDQTTVLRGGPGTIFSGLDAIEVRLASGDLAGPGATPAPETLRSLKPYFDLMGGFGGIQGNTGTYRLANLAIPLTSIFPPSIRSEVLSRMLTFLGTTGGTP